MSWTPTPADPYVNGPNAPTHVDKLAEVRDFLEQAASDALDRLELDKHHTLARHYHTLATLIGYRNDV